MKIDTNNRDKISVTFFKQSTGIPIPVSHKKVPLRLLFLINLRIRTGTNFYSGPWSHGQLGLDSEMNGLGCFWLRKPIRLFQLKIRSGSKTTIKRDQVQKRDGMGWLFCNPDWPGTACPVAVTNPANHPKNKARPAQSPFFYKTSVTFERKMKVESDSKNW